MIWKLRVSQNETQMKLEITIIIIIIIIIINSKKFFLVLINFF